MTPLKSPRELKADFPLPDAVANTVFEARESIKRIVRRQERRMLVVVGPCSIHDPAAALEYADRLYAAHWRYQERLCIVMRAYLEKPRTTVGWRGLLNDPHLDGSFDMGAGVAIARELLVKINALGLPVATEMLDPISPQYMDDLISLGAIGARTTESQTHRALASGVSMPVGFKNATDGNVQPAINACLSATRQHSFLGIDEDGRSAVVKTAGNPDGFVILRGGRDGPNYDLNSVAEAEQAMQTNALQAAIMVDCSHANCSGDYARQEAVWQQVLREHVASNNAVVGLMVESNLHEGKQNLGSDLSALRYGVSVTDGCVGWETTERMLAFAYEALGR
ncbi:MAG: 3-deoxy-7-phosphoheptulonate synthase [Chloroflexaceae bacterium]|nr:3-deoxy-7-phosphoheptulonate synthase [Chloroflexaceae bacterium]